MSSQSVPTIAGVQASDVLPAERLAMRFHEAYERLAPEHGYETRRASAKPWPEVPEQNRRLMVAVCGELLANSSDLLQDIGDVAARRGQTDSEVVGEGARPLPARILVPLGCAIGVGLAGVVTAIWPNAGPEAVKAVALTLAVYAALVGLILVLLRRAGR